MLSASPNARRMETVANILPLLRRGDSIDGTITGTRTSDELDLVVAPWEHSLEAYNCMSLFLMSEAFFASEKLLEATVSAPQKWGWWETMRRVARAWASFSIGPLLGGVAGGERRQLALVRRRITADGSQPVLSDRPSSRL
jgi:hypothetical protein